MFDVRDPYVPVLRHPDPQNFGTSQTGFAGNGLPTAVYPNGPPGLVEGSSYINTASGTEYHWYSGAWH